LLAICADVGSEGGQDLVGVPGVVPRDADLSIAAGAAGEIGSIRLASGNRKTVFPGALVATTGSNAEAILKVLRNPTFSASTGWAADANTPGLEVNGGRTVTALGRELLSIPFSTQTRQVQGELDPVLALAADYTGTSDVITLAVSNPGGTPITVKGALHYKAVI
jgi:hypothetical protein